MPDRESQNEKPRQSPDPRTDEGKQRSSKNALLHGCCSKAHRPRATALYDQGTRVSECCGRGPLCASSSKTLILPDESQDEFDQLFESWLRDYRANTFVLQRLVHETVTAQWLLIRNRSRYNRYEHSLHESEPNCLNWSEAQHKQYELFHRYLRQAERRFHSAFENLERTCGRRFREAMQLQHAQERAAAIELRSAQALERQKAKGNPHQCTKQTAERERSVNFSRPSERTANAVSSANRMNPFWRPLESNGQAVVSFRDQVPQCETFKKRESHNIYEEIVSDERIHVAA